MTPEKLLEHLFDKGILQKNVPINVETICLH